MGPTAEVRDARVTGRDARSRLTEGLPVKEHRADVAGTRTAWIEGGAGPPLVLLHGPGESGINWRWVIPSLTRDHRVVAPDLPGHGSSGGADVGWNDPWLAGSDVSLADTFHYPCPPAKPML